MAYWSKRNDNRVCVYVWNDGKQVQLPRKLTKHLDAEPAHNVQYWVDQYERTHEGDKLKLQPLSNSKLTIYIDDFCKHLTNYKKRSPDTVREHRSLLKTHVIPYFLSHDPPLTDPNQWPGVSVRMANYLIDNKVSKQVHRKCVNSLRVFWKWLEEEGIVQNGVTIRTRRPLLPREETPLQILLTPKEVLDFAARCSSPIIAQMALLGYFFSLRTNEVFALTKGSFRAGLAASSLEACKVMRKAELYDKFAIEVTKQCRPDGSLVSPKAGSKGWVACWDRDAALQIAKLLNKDVLPAMNPNMGMKQWKLHGIKNVTLKDLRRASIYWLGHNTTLPPISLMAHARHLHLATTQLYLRRPEEDSEEQDGGIDLDAM